MRKGASPKQPLLQCPAAKRPRRFSTGIVCSASDMARVVLWFKNDLRMHDNYVLNRAADLVANGQASEVPSEVLRGIQN